MPETHQPPTTSPAGPPHDRTPEETPPPTVYRIRHNVTESDEPQRKLVRARARGNRPPYAGGDTEPACPPASAASPPVIPAKAGILSPYMDSPSRNVLDVSLGVAVPYPSCQ